MDNRGVRYELDKMGSLYDSRSGIYFIKNSSPSGRAHWHDCYELEFIISGSADEIVNGCPYSAKRGDIFFLTPNDFHEIGNFKDFVCFGVMFPESVIDDRLLERLERRKLSNNLFLRLDGEQINKFEMLFSFMEEEMAKKSDGYADIVRNAVNMVIGLIIRDGFKEGVAKTKYSSVRMAVNYIQSNFRRDITLTEVARAVNLESKYFSVLFKKSIRVSFKSFLNETRLACAVNYLNGKDISVTEICYLCGFGSISNFNRLFKKEFGMSPREYRNRNKN